VAGRQRIDRVRRQYNQWVANQTLEDYALRFTAKSARRWSAARVANTALGAISFLALEAIGGTITLNYGVTNATAAILVVSVIIFLCGLPIAYHAAKCGIDIDLLTRGAGFGYIGSTITSLIYASFTFIFFAIEAVILATALELCFGIPRPVGYLISAVVIIPLVTHGITLISRFQLWTQPLWIVLHILPFAAIAYANPHSFAEWTKFPGEHGDPAGHLDLLLFGTAASVVFALVAQIGEQVDFLRFLPRDRRTSKTSWWIALLSAGPGWIILGALKLLAGSFLAYFALSHGVSIEHAAEPAHMYLEAFRYVLSQPGLALALTGAFVILSQLKINVTNAYAGSIAWSNFFSRLTHSHPGRIAADGDRRLQGAGADAGAVLQRCDCLGRRAGCRSRHQQAARAAPAAHGVQARAPL
jgi:purine-cytosine permease-like protein